MRERDFIHRNFGGQARPGDIASSVILTISRDDVPAIVADWVDARMVADHYGYLVWTGTVDGRRISACSSGLGSASAAVAIEELAALGVTTIIGLGASLTPSDRPIVADGAIRADAASIGYARSGFPAAAHPNVVMAIVAATRRMGIATEHSIVADIEAPTPRSSVGTRRSERAREMAALVRDVGAVAVDGSPATLFVQGSIHGIRTGFIARGRTPADGDPTPAMAIQALSILERWDGHDARTRTPMAARMEELIERRPAR
jgi:uridine phosphorylase